eukprot:11198098-Lingulodinium_polyedra.AAC.1
MAKTVGASLGLLVCTQYAHVEGFCGCQQYDFKSWAESVDIWPQPPHGGEFGALPVGSRCAPAYCLRRACYESVIAAMG